MPFHPKVRESVTINSVDYYFTEHPSAPRMAYGQTGRRATVYQVQAQYGKLHALKVFTKAWRDPRNATGALRLHNFANLPGLQVCDRHVLTHEKNADLIGAYPDLEYAVLMAWVTGETWQEVMLNGHPLTVEQSRELGLAFLCILAGMEQKGLAHCDLSGPNVLINFTPAQVALVDVEELYGPGLTRPDTVGSGSSGYAHKTASSGLWRADADRFAGGVLLAEMLGWCDERVRQIGYGEQYFDPVEMQQSSERYQVLLSVLQEHWGGGVADTFARVWFSEQLTDCPSFQEWDGLLNPESVVQQALNKQLAQAEIDAAEELLGNEQLDQAVLKLAEVYQLAPAAAAGTYARALLTRGTVRERHDDLEGALADYQKALRVAPVGGLRDELILIVAEIETKTTPDEAVSTETAMLGEEKIATESDQASVPPSVPPDKKPNNPPVESIVQKPANKSHKWRWITGGIVLAGIILCLGAGALNYLFQYISEVNGNANPTNIPTQVTQPMATLVPGGTITVMQLQSARTATVSIPIPPTATSVKFTRTPLPNTIAPQPTRTSTKTPRPPNPPTNTPKPLVDTSVPPTNTPRPTYTSEPPTYTSEPPTNTPRPRTNTPAPPTNTPRPTYTSEPPTYTSEPPTNTPRPRTNTPAPPTNTPRPTGTPVPPTVEPPTGTPVPPTVEPPTGTPQPTEG